MIIPTELDKIDRFKLFARDLPPCNMGHDDGIFIHVVEKGNGRLCIMLEVGETTTERELRKAESLATQWRDRLNEFQGRIDIDGNLLLQSVQQYFESGKTYAEIADIANAHVADLLCEYSKLPNKDTFKARSLLFQVREMLTILNAGQEDISTGKRGRRSKDDEQKRREWIDTVIHDSLKQIAKGEEPFDAPQSPISKSNVEYSVSQWRKKCVAEKT